jgi:ketosteroid isomerase-like protein
MSHENIVRKPLPDTRSASRTFDERLMLRFPRLSLAVGRFVLRLPARSRLRQTVIWRYVGQGFAAVNRRDFEAVLPKYNPRVEINVTPAILGLGDIEPTYRGREGYMQLYRDWLPAWGDGFRFKPRELIDLGDGRFVALVQADLHGQQSGIELERQIGFVWTLDDEARVVQEQNFLDWDEALEAVGLSE